MNPKIQIDKIYIFKSLKNGKMECFDHGKEMIGVCTWCGKSMCYECVGRRDGGKKYCRACTSKLGEVKVVDTVRERVSQHYDEKKKAAEEPELKVEPLPQKKPSFSFATTKRIDPRHFELDDADDLPAKTLRHERPTIVTTKPIVHEHPKQAMHSGSSSASSALGMFAAQAKQTAEKPRAEVKPQQSSTPEVSSSARSALGMFAAQAMETKKKDEEKKEQQE
jgi:hypothetical protein